MPSQPECSFRKHSGCNSRVKESSIAFAFYHSCHASSCTHFPLFICWCCYFPLFWKKKFQPVSLYECRRNNIDFFFFGSFVCFSYVGTRPPIKSNNNSKKKIQQYCFWICHIGNLNLVLLVKAKHKMFSCCCCVHFKPCLPKFCIHETKKYSFQKVVLNCKCPQISTSQNTVEQSKFGDSVALIPVSVSSHTPAASALTYVPKLSWNNYVT